MSEAHVYGWTVPETARYFRVSPDKIRSWIKRGELSAINTSTARCGRPRYVITPSALAAFERGRAVAAPSAGKHKRRRKQTCLVDYYPD
jgi:transposase